MLFKMFLTFLKIGAFTFGGGFAMIPIIQEEVVNKHNWIKEEEFLDTISVAQSAPGSIAVNSSIYVGYKIKGVAGAIVCTVGTVLPPFMTILVIAKFFAIFRDNPIFNSVFAGIRPAVVALIFSALYRLVYKSRFTYIGLGSALIVALIIGIFNISPIYLILLGVLVSILYNKKLRSRFGKYLGDFGDFDDEDEEDME